MDINRLQEFITLATLLNYSKAANQLYLTQPALSRHIHDLEQALGARLFIRDTHNVRLTSVGELFYKEAKEIVDRYNHALVLVKEATSITSGELKIGLLGTATRPFLSDFVIGFTTSHPQIRLSMHCDTLDILANQLNDGCTDLAFVNYVNKNYFAGLESEKILRNKLYVILHPSHPCANQKSVRFSDLSGLPAINFSIETNPYSADVHKKLFKKAGARYNVVQDAPNIDTALFLVSINEGFFFLPEYLLYMAKGLTILPMADDFACITLNLIWKKENINPSLPVFVDSFRAYMQNRKFKD